MVMTTFNPFGNRETTLSHFRAEEIASRLRIACAPAVSKPKRQKRTLIAFKASVAFLPYTLPSLFLQDSTIGQALPVP